MNKQVLALARYRLQQAHEALHEAEILQREQAWRGTINRAYYAMFYTVLALTVVQEFSTSKHAGVIAFFDREYVKTGIFPKETSKKLHLAFERRQVQDYGEFIIVDDSMAQETLTDAAVFVNLIETHLIGTVFPDLEA
jgi:uncharacterized protein (UPF0332 family)